MKKQINIFLILIVIVLSISLISAGMDWDNRKGVSDTFGKANYPNIEIKNTFGLGKTLWKGTLDRNTDTCGINCEAITIIELTEKGSLIDDVMFETIKEDGSRIKQNIRSYQFYIKTNEEQVKVDDYKYSCKQEIASDGTNYRDCLNRYVGWHWETEPLWKRYSLGTEMPKGTYKVKLEGEKKPSRTVDWIIQSQGEWLNEWATWSIVWDDTLVAYYSMDDNTDSLGILNLSNRTGTYATGLIGDALSNDYIWGDGVLFGALNTSSSKNFSMCFWTNSSLGGGSSQFLFSLNDEGGIDGADLSGPLGFGYGGGGTAWQAGMTGVYSSETTSRNNWQYHCLIFNGTSRNYYRNNVLVTALTTGITWAESDNVELLIGASKIDGTAKWDGLIDEVGFWNVALTPEQLTTLYNSGDGLTYIDVGNINLNSPTDNYISPTNSVDFNCSATVTDGAIITNMSLWHNGTGTWERNNCNYVTNYYNDPISNSDYTDYWYASNPSATSENTDYLRSYMSQEYGSENNYLISNVSEDLNLYNNGFDTNLSTQIYHQFSTAGSDPHTANIKYGFSNGTSYIWFRESSFSGVLTITEDYEWDIVYNGVTKLIDVYNDSVLYASDIDVSSLGEDIYFTTYNYVSGSGGHASNSDIRIYYLNITEPQFNSCLTISTITEPTLWTCEACDSDGDCGFATENRTILVDTNPPSITINSPSALEDIGYADVNQTLNWSITDSNFEGAWYNYNGTNVSLLGASNQTSFQLDGTDRNLTFYANDSVGNVNSTLVEWVYKVFVNEETYSATAIEGNTETFAMNITWDDDTYSSVDGYLNYNGVRQSIATKIGTGNLAYLSKDISIPAVSSDTNYTFLWEFLLGAEYVNSTSNNQSVSNINLAICNATNYQDLVINMSLYDEETNTYINNTALDSNIEIDLQITSRDSGITIIDYANQWTNQNNVSLCLANDTLDSVSYQIDYIITFKSDDHITEYLYMDNGTLDNSSSFNSLTDKSMFLMNLLSADSTSFLFNYLDSDGLVVDDIIVHAFRKYVGEGIFREIERAKQNDDGNTVLHLVEEDVIYYFIISKFSEILFTSNTYTALCQTTPCEIELSEAGGFEEFGDDWDLIDDGAYTINSNDVTREVNLSFETLDSSTFNLTVYRLNSTAGYESVGSDSATGTSGTLLVVVPASSGNESFFAVIEQDDVYINSEWVDMEESAGVYFGNTLAIFLAILIILTLTLMAVSEGSGTILFLILGLFLVMILGLVNFTTVWGVNILIYLIIAGGLLVWKLTRRNR